MDDASLSNIFVNSPAMCMDLSYLIVCVISVLKFRPATIQTT